MPKKSKHELIRCSHFSWRISRRCGVWYADGRANPISAGRHSLGTRNKAEALQALTDLDESRAVTLGLIKKPEKRHEPQARLSLLDGRRLYETHISRSRATGGVKPSTKKRYRAVFDKLAHWAKSNGVRDFDQVDAEVLNRYASHLENLDYAPKTILNELTTLKQCVRWLVEEGHLVGREPIRLRLRKVESQRAYCYRPVEVEAMLMHCRAIKSLRWISNVVTALACTGMRISELSTLKWADVDFTNRRIRVADESGHGGTAVKRTVKSGRSRSVPLHVDLEIVLRGLQPTDDFVFHGPKGGRLKPDFVRRMLVRHVLTPLAATFPKHEGRQNIVDGRLHSFRHYFISECAANGVPERVVMDWVGHADSAMVAHYFHLHDEEAQRRMNGLNLLGSVDGRSGDVSSVSQEGERRAT